MGEPVRIEFERSGGFAGISLKVSVDSGRLPPAEAAEIEALLDSLDLGTLAGATEPGKPDRFLYHLSIEQAGLRHEITVPEHNVTDELRPLIDLLTRRARGG